jgi:8-oxo-dGTP pyrophosphatase MutT (NUDIX family)
MSTSVMRRSARAILLDGPDLLLIKRTRPGEEPYWVTIGGGVEPEDATLEEAVGPSPTRVDTHWYQSCGKVECS